jgi:hypothetical protein
MKPVKEVAEAVEAKKEKDAGGAPLLLCCTACLIAAFSSIEFSANLDLYGLCLTDRSGSGKHVESESMKLVKEVAEAVEAKKEKDAGGLSFCHAVC